MTANASNCDGNDNEIQSIFDGQNQIRHSCMNTLSVLYLHRTMFEVYILRNLLVCLIFKNDAIIINI